VGDVPITIENGKIKFSLYNNWGQVVLISPDWMIYSE
jgi:hypothetical protein